ncbi:enhanced serine sensitivity protein SseB [Streptomyces sp. NPDC005438]|uniref:enhanced serine sensitivity protein SseB n=1 Tax=Streptomyces sp. NPDC005438 TaxID=3156880 RepID=UPI0033A46DC5
MTSPQQPQHFGPGHGGGWPSNELEEVLSSSLNAGQAGGRLLEVLARSQLWVPLPEGGGPDSPNLDLPTVQLDGAPYVPVFSSEQQFLQATGSHLSFAVAPAVEFARGLPPQVGVAVNPGGTVGVPLPPEAVAELCGAAPGSGVPGVATGARVRLFEPDWQQEPVDLLATAAGEFAAQPPVRSARRALASVEGRDPSLYIGVELDLLDPEARTAAHDALARALGNHPVRWPVQMVFLDAANDPMVEWMRQCVRPFYDREQS